MTRNIVVILLCKAGLLLSGSLYAATEHDHDHHHHDHQSAEHDSLQLNAGKRWDTDAPLRQGMQSIRDAVAHRLDDIHHDRASVAQYRELSKSIQEQLDYMFNNCKLPEDADAQLHILLANIINANQIIAQGDNPRDGVISVVQALDLYPQYFNHSGWAPLPH